MPDRMPRPTHSNASPAIPGPRPTLARSVLLGATLLGACNGKSVKDSGSECAAAPTAAAGSDQSVTLGNTVTLDGTGSQTCGSCTDKPIYTWRFDTTPTGSTIDDSALSDNGTSTASNPTFTPDVAGDYVLGLSVSDCTGDSAEDLVVVHAASDDQPPVADCGSSYSGLVDKATTLDGSNSYDPEGASLEYAWALSSGPDCTALTSSDLYNKSGPNPSLVPDCEGIYVVSLVVNDGNQWSDPAFCWIDVASGNHAPVADAGTSANLGACPDNPFSLSGWGSYDLDGDDLTYQWSLLSAPPDSAATDANISDPSSPNPTFTWDVTGDYSFQLQVYDGTEWSAPDVVTYTIEDVSGNHSPIANAGDDQSIDVTADCTTSSYVWTCDDCEAQTVELDASSSYDPDGDELSYSWSESTNTVSFSNAHGAITDATIDAQPAEYGVSNTMTLDVTLRVADCVASDDDTVTINYSCTGN